MGEGLFGRLNGIFALALVDVKAREVVLVRDPVGVKPLYVGRSNGLLWWSSELGAAKGVGLASPEVSADALKLFLTFRFIPSPYTIFEDVWKLPPGHFVRIRSQGESGRPTFVPFEHRRASLPTADIRHGFASDARGERGSRRRTGRGEPGCAPRECRGRRGRVH